MADIGNLPQPGQKPWSLNPAITAMNDELNNRLGSTGLNSTFAPGGTAGNINKSTAQGIALVQALIFGGN